MLDIKHLSKTFFPGTVNEKKALTDVNLHMEPGDFITGYNPQMIRAQGVDTNIMLLIGLFFSNALVAVAGALVAQSNGFADVGMGVGTIVIGLASVIIGEVLFGTRSFKNSLISVILGSIVYRLVIAIVLQMGMPPNDLKLFTAVLVAIALSLPMVKGKFQSRKAGI